MPCSFEPTPADLGPRRRTALHKALAALIAAGLAALAAPGLVFAGDLASAFGAGELSHAEALLGRSAARDDEADAAARCKALLFANRLKAASACLEGRLAAKPDDKASLLALPLVQFRHDDFAAAAALYEKAGRPAKAAEAAALATAPAYGVFGPSTAQRIAFVQTDPLPILNVRLGDGADHAFVLDTGAAETVLDPGLAQALGLTPLTGDDKGVFAGGRTAPVRYAMLPALTLGAVRLERIPVQLLSTAPFSQALGGARVEGVLGVDVLRRFRVTIDYPRHALVLDRFPPPPGRAPGEFPFWMASDHLLLSEAAIDGTRELALIDTGLAGEGCTLPASTLAAIGERTSGPSAQGVGGGGAVAAAGFKARSISIGLRTKKSVDCLLGPFPPSLETATGARIGLLVSHAFLKDYALTIDFQRMRMRLDAD